MTAEETIASLEAQLKQALERLDEVTEQLRMAVMPTGYATRSSVPQTELLNERTDLVRQVLYPFRCSEKDGTI